MQVNEGAFYEEALLKRQSMAMLLYPSLVARLTFAVLGAWSAVLGACATAKEATKEEQQWCSVNAARTDYRGCFESEPECAKSNIVPGHRCEPLGKPYCVDDGAFFHCFEQESACAAMVVELQKVTSTRPCVRAWPSEMSR